jgi:hypothetical protein
MLKTYYRTVFWRTLPPRSYALLLVAIFFTFSSIGDGIDLWRGGAQSIGHLALNVVYAGLIGVGYGHGAMRNWRFIPLTAAIQLLVILTGSGSTVNGLTLEAGASMRLIVDGAGVLVSMIAGYVFFIVFISGEGVRHIRLRTEIDLAREMHSVLVPPIDFRNRRLEISGASVPTSEVGGDLLDLVAAEGALTCYIADISGHGVGANLLMGMLKSALRTRLAQQVDLATLVTDINRALYPLRKPSMFLTVAAVRFTDNAAMEFLVAGHLPILHYRAAGDAVVSLTTRQIGVGIQAEFPFRSDTVRVDSGDCLLLATDGVTEVEDGSGSPFGMERLAALLREHCSRPAKEIHELISSSALRHGTQKDDQTLMVIRCIGREEVCPASQASNGTSRGT